VAMHQAISALDRFLAGQALPAYLVTHIPGLEAGKLVSAEHLPALARDAFLLVRHKGQDNDGLDISPLLAGRSKIVFSNEVFVVFAVAETAGLGDGEKSYYVYWAQRAAGSFRALSRKADAPIHGRGSTANFLVYVGENTVLTKTIYGDKIYLDSQDTSLAPSIMISGIWEAPISQLLERNMRKGDVFFDIGANCGYFALLASRLAGQDGFTVAVEPQEALASRIRRSLSVNGYTKRSIVVNAALGETNATRRLNLVGSHTGSAFLAPELKGAAPVDESTEINMIDFASLLGKTGRKRFPDVIKIDVEGYEYACWRSMGPAIAEAENLLIIMEFSPMRYGAMGDDPVKFLREMAAAGLAVHMIDRTDKVVPVPPSGFDVLAAAHTYVDIVLAKGDRMPLR
jgi:FkbM family methyltransferase